MTAERIIATSAAILAGASGIGIGVEGANNSVLKEKSESTNSNSLLDIDGQVVKSEDEQGESGESVSDGKRFTEDDLGVLTTKHDMIRGKIQRKVQQKKDARTKIKKPRRDRAGVWDYRPSAFAVVRGEKDHAKEQPRALDRVLQEKVQECLYDETTCDCCVYGYGYEYVPCSGVDRTSSCIGLGSCNAGYACDSLKGDVGNDSCNGYNACGDLNGNVDKDSCNNSFACYSLEGDVGEKSCQEYSACEDLNGTVGDESCLGERSCFKLEGHVGSNSCTEPAFYVDDLGFVGGCYGYNGDIPNNCPSVKALKEGNCTTAHPSISAAPSTKPSTSTSPTSSAAPSSMPSANPSFSPTSSTQPSTSPTSSAAPSSMPSAAPKSGKSSKSPKSKASKNGKAPKLSDLEEQSSKAMDYDFIEQMSLPSSLWEESLSMLF